ncbi:MAG: hypothetical protein R3B13_20120 [Polyangiaceae bacterium]
MGVIIGSMLLIGCGSSDADPGSGAAGTANSGGAGNSGGSGNNGGSGNSGNSGGAGNFGGSGGIVGAGAFGGARAFPGAEGYGTDTPGGRGGKVYVVTTLDWSGPGSFSEALFATGPRIIVFRVSGVIDVPGNAAPLDESHSYVTVAGQTSPGGITFRGGGAALNSYHSNFHDGVFRFLRFRGNNAYDNISINEAHHFVFDHCDFSGAEDETFDVTFSHDFTVQWSTVTNSESDGQNYGQLVAYLPTANISMHHNFSAHHVNRCGPHMHWGSEAPSGPVRIDYRNNVIYNCTFEKGLDISTPSQGSLEFNLVGNYAKAGPGTPKTAALIGIGSTAAVYDHDNVYDPGHDIFTIWSDPKPASAAFAMPEVTTDSAQDAYDRVLDLAGAWPRDAMNVRTVDEARKGTGQLGKIDDPLITSGPEPPPDADLDGMPDDWEKDHGLDPNDAADAALDADSDGYTNIEHYLHELALTRLAK